MCGNTNPLVNYVSPLRLHRNHSTGIDELLPRTLSVMDFDTLVKDVYTLASSSDPIAGPVKEALDVIENALDTYG
jgi:hypothetical protein